MKQMKIILLTVVCGLWTASAHAFDDTRCRAAESALIYELESKGSAQAETIEDHVRHARIYRAMVNRGCPQNSDMYKQYSYGSLDAARALVYVEGYTGREKARYDAMIKRATGF
ncbi:MAG: hypothetical protein LBQ49_02815 [Rickettsiales bacterium]|jgi:hypothetical protein|nr:hypothetical protein [Rickettsiales bacterium]